MGQLNGGQAAYQALVSLGVKHVFGIPSIHNLPIFDAIAEGGAIEPIITRHEQAAVHSADGYSRATGELGVVIASTGPGTTNTVTGLYESKFASSRVLLITGQVESIYYGKGMGPGHEADNQIAMLQTVVDHVESVGHCQQIPGAIFAAAAAINEGRPGPAAVEICIDLQYATGEMDTALPANLFRQLDRGGDEIDVAVKLLAESNKRLIVAGGGVVNSGASDALVKLAESLNAPVFTSGNGRGAIPETHPLCQGVFMGPSIVQQAIADADVVLAVGTWFHGGERVWNVALPGKLIHVDIDPHAQGLVHKPTVSIVGDAGEVMTSLTDKLNAEPGSDGFLNQVSQATDHVKANLREQIGVDQASIMDHIRANLGEAELFVRDMTVPAYTWGNQLFPVLKPRTTMNPTSGAIGPGLPMANGAAIATGKKTVVMHGDGGFMVHASELATTVQYNLPLVICVFTDGGYGVLRGFQNKQCGRLVGVDLATPNFAAMARSIGMRGESVNSAAEFADVFADAMKYDGPLLIDIDQKQLVQIKGMGHPRAEFSRPAD